MLKYILYILLYPLYCITKLLKINQDKITFISYKTNKLEGNYKIISKEINKLNSFEQKFILLKYNYSIWGNFIYMLNCFKQVYHINTSKLVILDYNNFVISNLKREEVKVLQIWHASGAIKKFGNDIGRDYRIKNYDYLITTSSVWKSIYKNAFGVKEENIIVTGIPRNDNLYSKKKINKFKQDMQSKFPKIKDKKVVLYCPTFRGDGVKQKEYLDIDLNLLEKKLGDNYVIIYKLHPCLEEKTIVDNNNIINANFESLTKLFSITDYLITDYSSILFDFSILERPIISFVPDIEKYKEERGMYFDYKKEIPSKVCLTEEEVARAITENKFDIEKIKKFKNKYFEFNDNKSKKRVLDLIIKIMSE